MYKDIMKIIWRIIGIVTAIVWIITLFSKKHDVFDLVAIGVIWIISSIETKEND